MIELIICDDDAMSLTQTRQFLAGMMHLWNEEIEIGSDCGGGRFFFPFSLGRSMISSTFIFIYYR